MSYNKGTIIFPADQYYVQLDNTKGIDYVCILYANESLNIEEIMQKMEKLEGDIYSRLSESVGKKRIIPAIDYSKEGKIGFRATRNINESGKIVPLIVEIRHE